MKKLLALTILGVALIAPANAAAHTLSVGSAKHVVKRIAYKIADPGEYYGAVGCYRLSRHSVVCTARTYDEVEDVQCDVPIKVSFVNASSYRTRWSQLEEVDCY